MAIWIPEERIQAELAVARQEAEKQIGFQIEEETAKEILDVCIRKLKLIKQDINYLPLLYRYELPLKVQGMAINKLSWR